MLLFYTNKSTDPNSKEGRRSHGVLTYYFCKIIYDDPSTTAQRVVERLNAFMNRFGHSITCESTTPEVMNEPVYQPCPHPTEDPIDEALDDQSESDSNENPTPDESN